MRVIGFTIILTCAALVNAQYYSSGWTPGQPASAVPEASSVPTSRPSSDSTNKPPNAPPLTDLSELLSFKTILRWGPIAGLFSMAGINITEGLAGQKDTWDNRIPLITDDNYEELIVNEPLTEQEGRDRVWIIIVSSKQETLSPYVDEVFDSAYNITQIENDLPNVRWGRVDYLNVTYLTTKWAIWQVPYLVVLKDRGATLRFYRPQHVRMKDDALREFMLVEGYNLTPPWSGIYAPGGEREWIMHFVAKWLTRFYNVVVRIPRLMIILGSGAVASLIMGYMHRGSAPKKIQRPKPVPQVATQHNTNATQGPSTPVTSATKPKARKRKGGTR